MELVTRSVGVNPVASMHSNFGELLYAITCLSKERIFVFVVNCRM